VTVSETAFDTAGLKDSEDVTVHHTLREVRRYLGLATRELMLVRGAIVDQSRPVDEELSGVPSPISLHADFDTVDELITAIIVSTPAVSWNSYEGEGTAVTPIAGTTVASLDGGAALPAGQYTVTGTDMLTGTVTAADINNLGLYVGATLIQVLPNADNPETLYPWGQTLDITVPPGGAIVAVKTIGAGSGTANYWSSFEATPALTGIQPVTLQLGSRTFTLPPGVITIAPIRMLLSKTDQRILTWTQGGNGSLEIMGYAAGDAG
jgi:hypothetical protein